MKKHDVNVTHRGENYRRQIQICLMKIFVE